MDWGTCCMESENAVQAQEAFRQSIALFQSLLTRSPDDRDLKYQLAISQSHLAPVIHGRQKPDGGGEHLSQRRDVAAELVADEPGNPEYRDFQAAVLRSWGEILPELGRSPEAEAILRQAVTIEEGLVRDFPQVPMHQDRAGQYTRQSWALCWAISPSPRSRSRFSVGRWRSWRSWRPNIPRFPTIGVPSAGGLNNIAAVLMDRGNWEEARQLLEQAIVHQKAALEINPAQNDYQQSLSSHLQNLTEVQLALGDQAAAARTAEDYAHHVNLVRSPGTLHYMAV